MYGYVSNNSKPQEEDVLVLNEIAEEEVPLAELPEELVPLTEIPAMEENLEELAEEDVPLAELPATGDTSTLWMVLALLSGMGLLVLTKKEKAA